MMMLTRYCSKRNGGSSSSSTVFSLMTTRIRTKSHHQIQISTRLYHQTATVSDRFTKLRKGQAGRYWKEVKQRQKKERAENKKKQSVIDADITAAAIVQPIHYLGPLGRPAFTEAKLQELLIPTPPKEDELITATTKQTTTELAEKSESSSEAQLYGDGLANVEALIGLNLKDTTGLGTSNRTPKMVWMEMEQKIQFEKPQFRMELYNLNEKGHEVAGTKLRRNGNLLHKVTAVTVIPNDILPANLYEQMKAHQHVGKHADYDWLELISVGIGSTKKRSTQLAALDQIALLKETSGIDLTLPKHQWMSLLDDPDDKQQQQQGKISSTLLSKEEEKEIFALKYEQSVTLLELLQCSRIKYDHEEVVASTKVSKNAGKSRGKGRTRRKKKASNKKAWVAEAETMYQGKYYFSTGEKASNKKEAEKQALVALFEQNEDSLLQTEAEVYQQLMEESPSGKYVSTLSIPPLPETIYNNLHDSLGYHNIYNDNEEGGLTIITEQEQHEERKQQHQLLKQQYELELEATQRRRKEQQPNHRRRNPRQAITSSDESVSQYLYDQEHTKLENQRERNSKAYTKMEDARRALPIYQIREPLLEKLKSNQVIVISGGTGSGKSTQCPQYILEDALENLQAAKTRILVTQPRRIAAISVSERVAAERYEPKQQGSNKHRSQQSPPSSVGYAVRFKSKKPRANGGSIEFVTTGILLRRLLNGDDALLEGVSHVMIDEVHERDINTDFLLILFRDLLKKRPDLKLILMSATLDAKSFSDYFSESNISNISNSKDDVVAVADSVVPLLSVPAKPRHPVEVHYLEDLLLCAGEAEHHDECAIRTESSTTYSLSPKAQKFASSLLQFSDDQLQREYEKMTNDIAFASSSSSSSSLNEDSINDNVIVNKERMVNLKKALAMRKESSSSLSSPLPYFDFKKFDFKATMTGLISEIALHLCRSETSTTTTMDTDDTAAGKNNNNNKGGSILCFLPGMDEIKACTKYIEEHCARSSGNPQLRNRIQIIQLHSTIPQDDQQKVFEPAETYTSTVDGTILQRPKIKLIFATNIAESSITIDDVIAVIDSGLVREMNFDANTAVDTMETNQISQASATQRLGRCGRVGPGQCYRLFSSSDIAANILKDRPIPEIQRTSLEATCLQTCSMMMNNNNQNHNNTDSKSTDDEVVGVKDFLSRAMDPPEDESIAFAMDRLTKLGAISLKKKNENVVGNDDTHTSGGQSQSREYLTPLGRYLARLPLDPATGKMLVMGVVMKCLDPLLTAAACFSSKNAFHEPPALREETKEIRKSFSDTSDIMGMVKAYTEFWYVVEEEGWRFAKEWAYTNSVSISAMIAIKAVRSQLLNELRKVRLIPPTDFHTHQDQNNRYNNNNFNRSPRQNSGDLRAEASVNENAECELLTSAIWCTAFPENLASRRRMATHFGVVQTSREDHAGLHPSSVLFHRKPPSSQSSSSSENYYSSNNSRQRQQQQPLPDWYLYRDKVLTSQLFLRTCSALTPEQIVLFGGYNLVETTTTTTNTENGPPLSPPMEDIEHIDETSLSSLLSSSLSSSSASSLSSTTTTRVSQSKKRIRGILDGWIAIESRTNNHNHNHNHSEKSVDLLIRARENLDMIFERRIMFPNQNNNNSYNSNQHSYSHNSNSRNHNNNNNNNGSRNSILSAEQYNKRSEEDDSIIQGIRQLYDELEHGGGRIYHDSYHNQNNNNNHPEDFHDYLDNIFSDYSN